MAGDRVIPIQDWPLVVGDPDRMHAGQIRRPFDGVMADGDIWCRCKLCGDWIFDDEEHVKTHRAQWRASKLKELMER